jgi:hypothetical protein
MRFDRSPDGKRIGREERHAVTVPRKAWVLALAAMGLSVLAEAQEMAVESAVQYQLFVKILKYDKTLMARTDTALVIGILFQSGFRSSYLAKEDFLKAMAESQDKLFDQRPIKYAVIDLDKETDLQGSFSRSKMNILYLTPLRAFDLGPLLSIAQAQKLLTLTGVPEYVDKGVAVGLGLKGNRPEILIHLPAAKAEGADFSSNLLKLVRIIHGQEGPH